MTNTKKKTTHNKESSTSTHNAHKKGSTQSSHNKTKTKKDKSYLWLALVIVILVIGSVIIARILPTGNDGVASASQLKLSIDAEGDFKVTAEKTSEKITINNPEIEYLSTLFQVNAIEENMTELINEAVLREVLYFNAKDTVESVNQEEIKQIFQQPGLVAQIESLGLTMDEFLTKYQTEIEKDYVIQEYLNEQVLKQLPAEKMLAANHILICYTGTSLCNETRTKDEALSLANSVASLAKKDSSIDNFAELAKEYSTGPSGPSGGFLGTFGKGQMIPEFEEEAFRLNAGEVSSPVETMYGYHIIRVDEIIESPNPQIAMQALMSLREQIKSNAEIVIN